ncbi:aspartate aminotransferase family protein, partial [Actinotalea ferrariae]|uniref:pyridoxal phosphate-dependent decarboxylase family protein n=1 Tax=Actinotalea ferrariae TaxID=1386098 RepID=UPI001C8BFDEE
MDGSPAPTTSSTAAADALATLRALRDADPPTHGGRVLSYVYDPGRADLDELAAEAARLFQPVNGLDPTTFRSVARLERDLVALAREVLHGDPDVVGSVTSGGTESCLLAVKAARDAWRAARPERGDVVPRLVLPTTAHPAFRKAAHYLGLALVEVPVDVASGAVRARTVLDAVGEDADATALVVVSAPAYPFGALDPVAEVAAGAAALGVACHVDACFGGWVLPWWPGDLPAWDLSVPGVTSLSADLHKFGYTPKGASVLLHRGRERLHHQYFATKGWPGYPVVNATMLGSRAAGPLAAAWAVTRALGVDGYAGLTRAAHDATVAVRGGIEATVGLRVVGAPTGPVLAVACDDDEPAQRQVDPFRWVDALRARGWLAQCQPGMTQPDGTRLPRTAHLTLTAVTAGVAGTLVRDAAAAADDVRG